MKINFSLSLKLTLIAFIISAPIISYLTYDNIRDQNEFVLTTYSEKAIALAQAMDASIVGYGELRNQEKLLTYISKFIHTNPEILELSISLPNEEKDLEVFVSSNSDFIHNPPTYLGYHDLSYTSTKDEKNEDKDDRSYYILENKADVPVLTVITPLHVSGQIEGTYQIVLSMDSAYAALDDRVKRLVLFSFLMLLVLILSFLYLLRRTIVKPIVNFRDAANLIGEGNLDTKIAIDTRDELGELADAFNNMTADLKMKREEVEKYSKVLEKMLNQKDEFIGQLGHDLKNPLTPLVGLLPMIIERETDPLNKEQLKLINKNVEYMRDLIYKTLKLAHLRSDKTMFDFETLDLYDQVTKIVDTQKLFLEKNGAELINRIQKGTEVIADDLRLTEIFNNLITNSIKYTPEGQKGSITIDAFDEKDFVTISVHDTGIGMTEEQKERIFDEFYKADESRHELDSSGLGLSICRRIVERHGGRIWAESKGPGKGSTFYFTLKKSF